MTTTQQLAIESMKVYVRQMASDVETPHIMSQIKDLGETKLTSEQCRIITNLMRSCFNLNGDRKI